MRWLNAQIFVSDKNYKTRMANRGDDISTVEMLAHLAPTVAVWWRGIAPEGGDPWCWSILVVTTLQVWYSRYITGIVQ